MTTFWWCFFFQKRPTGRLFSRWRSCPTSSLQEISKTAGGIWRIDPSGWTEMLVFVLKKVGLSCCFPYMVEQKLVWEVFFSWNFKGVILWSPCLDARTDLLRPFTGMVLFYGCMGCVFENDKSLYQYTPKFSFDTEITIVYHCEKRFFFTTHHVWSFFSIHASNVQWFSNADASR